MKKAILLFILVVFPLSFLLFFGVVLKHKFKTLPYYHPSELLVLDSTDNDLGKSYTIPEFEFINFDGSKKTKSFFDDNVYLLAPYSLNSEYVSVITKRLLTANFKYRDEDNIKIVGLNSEGAVTDENKLKDYRTNLFSNSNESNNFFYLSSESNEVMSDFISNGLGIKNIENSSLAVLIDTKGKIRGRYNLNAERQINDAIADIALLRKELDIKEYEASKTNSDQ